jgi:catechol 2,3-dioxygenase-like lactoylglutathione lyase family enzyme
MGFVLGWLVEHEVKTKEVFMATFKIEGVTHWSIPVNNLKDSEDFYGGLLGLKPLGRLNNNVMSCFNVGDHNILLCEREKPQDKSIVEDRVHHSFTVSPEGFVQACKTFHEKKIPIVELEYRAKGHFTGRELYFYDPSGNRLEIRDPSWKKGMPETPYEEIVKS